LRGSHMTMLKARQRIGKYRIIRRIARGGFADVFQALDTIEGVRVALKVPQPGMFTNSSLTDFQKEVRVSAKLDHPNILPIKNADYIDGIFVVVYPLGDGTLTERFRTRLSVRTAVRFAEQILEAVAYAHENGVIHCDVKPDNLIRFPGNLLRLTDFGLAKIEWAALTASGSGTVGYVAPEQAMGRPSCRSDVFSIGLILSEMFFGELPKWPFDWPPPGLSRARRRIHPDLIALLRRALEVNERRRFQDARQMRDAFRRIKPRVLAYPTRRRRSRRPALTNRDWKQIRRKEFRRRFGKTLEIRAECRKCGGPISERMLYCPWCGHHHKVYRDETTFPARCGRCGRGMKLDWRFCPWCYGPGVEPETNRSYSDVRYEGRCRNPACERKDLIPFMRYCPWCRTKVRRNWKLTGSTERCKHCGWGVVSEFWDHCPWCGRRLRN
jgi:serine/threonine protein kinase